MNKVLSSSIEDYLETIYILKKSKKVVRLKDISKFLNVKMSSVHSALHVLKDKGMVVQEHYGYVELTKKGKLTAKKIYDKHNIIKKFLSNVLSIKESTAETDACKLEHFLSKESLNKLEHFFNSFVKTKNKI